MAGKLRRITIASRRTLRRSTSLQLLLIIAIWWLCDRASEVLGLGVPGGVLAMLVLLAPLAGGWIRLPSLSKGADWLLTSMLLFFVPALVVLIDMPELFGLLGLKLLLVVITGTATVMLVTAATVVWMQRWTMPDEP